MDEDIAPRTGSRDPAFDSTDRALGERPRTRAVRDVTIKPSVAESKAAWTWIWANIHDPAVARELVNHLDRSDDSRAAYESIYIVARATVLRDDERRRRAARARRAVAVTLRACRQGLVEAHAALRTMRRKATSPVSQVIDLLPPAPAEQVAQTLVDSLGSVDHVPASPGSAERRVANIRG